MNKRQPSRQIFLPIIVLFCTCIGFAEAGNKYSLTTTTDAYQPLAGATNLPIPWLTKDSLPYAFIDQDLGVFDFFGTKYTLNMDSPVYVSALGNLLFVNETSGIVIDGFFTSLDSVNANARVSYLLEGTPGNYIVKVQWSTIGFTGCSSNDVINFQIWLYQKTGDIEMRYGPNMVNCNNAYDGESGPYTGIFQGPTDLSDVYQIFWLGGNSSSPVRTSSFTRLVGAPPNGTVYRLTSLSTAVPEETLFQNGAELYPNPAGNRLQYAILNMGVDRTIKIRDITGRVVKQEVQKGEQNDVHLDGVQPGIYFLEIQTGKSLIVRKFVKL